VKANGRLRELRKAKKLGIRSMADLVEVNRSHLSRVERGIKTASPEMLARSAKVLGVPVGDITDDSC
jgi:transcriptional regulator with XRE-family HTH domain